MRVGRFASFGDPSLLQIADHPDPAPPRGDEVLVAVHASSVNGTDLGLRRGDLKVATWGRMPFVPGFDLAGEVIACGERVTAFDVGDRVMALLGHRGGGLAERVTVCQDRVARVPDGLPLVEAAALPLAGLTALQALYGLARLRARREPRVLVLGASGGIGSFAVPLAVLGGAHVVGTAGAAKLEHVRRLGAHEVLDRRHMPSRQEPFDVVLDAGGHATFAETRPLLGPQGIMVSVRPLHPDVVRTAVGTRRYAAVRTRARSSDLAHLAELVTRGLLAVPLDRVLPLDAAAEAHRHAETEARGKVVISLER